ncbi:MAG: hypothetical protein LBJ57_03915, partial [Prevotellaceae bacterium]|nr:hypothetical protein [Prevotellaceae bacterium]
MFVNSLRSVKNSKFSTTPHARCVTGSSAGGVLLLNSYNLATCFILLLKKCIPLSNFTSQRMLVSCSKTTPTIYMLQATKHTAAGYGFCESPEGSEVMKPAAWGLAACAWHSIACAENPD